MARGTGPVLATIAAIAFFGERPAPLALAGAVLVAVGVFVIASGSRPTGRGTGDTSAAVSFALLTGVAIAGYTLWTSMP